MGREAGGIILRASVVVLYRSRSGMAGVSLLALVQRDNRVPARVLAERAGLSESVALRRLRRLRREGVIAADGAVARPAALGLPLTVIALVSLRREGEAALDDLANRIRGRLEVLAGLVRDR